MSDPTARQIAEKLQARLQRLPPHCMGACPSCDERQVMVFTDTLAPELATLTADLAQTVQERDAAIADATDYIAQVQRAERAEAELAQARQEKAVLAQENIFYRDAANAQRERAESALQARDAAREAVAEMMLHSGFATGHGDTLGDLLTTLHAQVEDVRQGRDAALESLAVASAALDYQVPALRELIQRNNMLPKETVSDGASLTRCEFCGEVPAITVLRSAAGYYIGYACCSPFSRESGYYPSFAQAQMAFDLGEFGR